MPLKLKETNISNEHNRLKNPYWREADQLAIYKHDRGVELGVDFTPSGVHDPFTPSPLPNTPIPGTKAKDHA